MHRALVWHLLVCAATLLARASGASADPNGTPVCAVAGDQQMPVIVPDGFGGAVIAWHDQRPGAPAGGVCYAQRVDASGTPMWAPDGVALSTTGDASDPVIAPDGGGGAYIAFGGQGTAPRVQWINSGGAVQWGADGVTLSTATTQARELAIAHENGGGGDVLVAWRQDNGNSGSSDIFAQRVSFQGILQWSSLGQAVEATANNEMLPALISDGAGGAVIAWVDGTAGGVKIQGLKSNGVGAWSRFALSTTANNMAPSILPDGSGGTIVGWSGGGSYVQRVSGLGSKLWASAGVLLSTGGNSISMLSDNFGGVIAAWQDFRSTTNYNIYAQHVTNAGSTLWGVGGAAVCTATQDQRLPQIVSDDSTGAIITWFDDRSGATGSDIYAQHLDATSTAQWPMDGIPLCTAPDNQEYPAIVSDKAGGAFVVWQDHRSGTNDDIYLQRVSGDAATLAVPPGGVEASSRAWPNPFFDRVQMPFALPAAEEVRMSVIDVGGRIVRDLGSSWMAGGAHELQWDGRTSAGTRADPGLYFLRVSGSGLALSRPVVRYR